MSTLTASPLTPLIIARIARRQGRLPF